MKSASDHADLPLWKAYAHPRYWPTWMGLGLLWCIAQLPLPWQRGLGRVLGLMALHLLPRRRRIAETNLALCFPELSEAERRQLLRESFIDNAIGYFEAASAWFAPMSRFSRITTTRGLEHLEQARAGGRGVILLGGHFSTLDLGGALFNLYSTAGSMQRNHDNPLFNAVMTRSREKFCTPILHKDNLRGLVKALRGGSTVWYATDQDYGMRGTVFAPFFSIPTATLTTTARLAERTGAAVVPFSHFRTRDGYVLYFDPALENYPSGDDVYDATRTNLAVEQAIRRAPSQYLWMHRRFKTRPPGAEPIDYDG